MTTLTSDLFGKTDSSVCAYDIRDLRGSTAALTILFFAKKMVVSLIDAFARAHITAIVLMISGPVRRKSFSDSSCLSDSLSNLIVLKSFSHVGSTRKLLHAYRAFRHVNETI